MDSKKQAENIETEIQAEIDTPSAPEISEGNSNIDAKEYCLNCGTKLNGTYCHNCGQHISDHTLTVKRFLLNYLDNSFLWDPLHIKTIGLLIRRPGYLTNEYIAGKYVSQVQPLKLNMFLLLVFITLFLFFASNEKINDSIQNFTNDELVFSIAQLSAISEDVEYLEKIKATPRDTINLLAPLDLANTYPSLIEAQEVLYNSEGTELDRFVAVVPRLLIEDKIIILNDEGYYHFNIEIGSAAENMALLKSVWEELSNILLQYLPIIILLTAPFLSFSLSVVQHKKKRPFLDHFIFSMHYIAFIELTAIALYLLHLIFNPPMDLLSTIFTLSSCIYFTISFHEVYKTTWFRSITKALLSSLIYYGICVGIFTVVILIACFVVAFKLT